jgi:hypothetical protein
MKKNSSEGVEGNGKVFLNDWRYDGNMLVGGLGWFGMLGGGF